MSSTDCYLYLYKIISEIRGFTVWKDVCEGIDQGDSSAYWLSTYLKVDCRLVRMAPSFTQQVDLQYVNEGDPVNFADGFPFLLTSEGSLDDLNKRLEERLAQRVPMNRFRPRVMQLPQ